MVVFHEIDSPICIGSCSREQQRNRYHRAAQDSLGSAPSIRWPIRRRYALLLIICDSSRSTNKN